MKEKMYAVIRTSYEKIKGFIYKLPQNRLLDMLNQGGENFIPVTKARYPMCKRESFFLKRISWRSIKNKSSLSRKARVLHSTDFPP